jgi:hypothetical protein
MNLTGAWKGQYVYGEGYPTEFIGRTEYFEFDIVDNNGAISGTCMDPVVKSKEGNESYILGSFRDNQLNFKKRYRFHLVVDESGFVMDDNNDVKFDGVDYTGRSYKRFWSRRIRFSGEWSITSQYTDENGLLQSFICKGSWKMKKVR